MKYKFQINSGVWIIPNVEFDSEWAVWLYIKSIYKDVEIKDHKIIPVLPESLKQQA